MVGIFTLPACAALPAPCTELRHCSGKFECLANRCVPLGASPVQGTERRVLEAKSVGVPGRAPGEQTIRLGRKPWKDKLYIEFDPVKPPRRLDAAFLLMRRSPATLPPDGSLKLNVRALLSPLSSRLEGRGLEPRAGSVEAPGLTGAGDWVRVDVTALLNSGSNKRKIHGFVIQTDGTGAWSMATGLGQAPGPQLELYFGPSTRANAARQ